MLNVNLLVSSKSEHVKFKHEIHINKLIEENIKLNEQFVIINCNKYNIEIRYYT